MPVTRRMRKNSRNLRSVRRRSYSRNRKLNRSQKMRGGRRNNKRKRSKSRSYKMRGGSSSLQGVAALTAMFESKTEGENSKKESMLNDNQPQTLEVHQNDLENIYGIHKYNYGDKKYDIFKVTYLTKYFRGKPIPIDIIIKKIGDSQLAQTYDRDWYLQDELDIMDQKPPMNDNGKYILLAL